MDTQSIELDALAVFSHPDDAELTVSGTLLKLKSLGYRTGVLDMTRGEMGTRGTPEVRAREAREAARLASMRRYDEEFGLDAVRMPALAHSVFSRLVVPSFVVDVSEFIEEKMRAIRAHASQFYSPDSEEPQTRISEKGFLQQIEWRMRYYGSLIGAAAGEAFYVRETFDAADPVELLAPPM